MKHCAIRFLLARHKAALDVYNEAQKMTDRDWVSCAQHVYIQVVVIEMGGINDTTWYKCFQQIKEEFVTSFILHKFLLNLLFKDVLSKYSPIHMRSSDCVRHWLLQIFGRVNHIKSSYQL
jgi:hypothetical protein